MSEPTTDDGSVPFSDGLVEVRTTMRPWEPLRVTERERQHLRNEGLLDEQIEIAEKVATTPAATPTPAAGKTTTREK